MSGCQVPTVSASHCRRKIPFVPPINATAQSDRRRNQTDGRQVTVGPASASVWGNREIQERKFFFPGPVKLFFLSFFLIFPASPCARRKRLTPAVSATSPRCCR